MRIIPKILFLTIAVLVLVLSSTSASASVVTNGDFETGDLTGWTADSAFSNSYAPLQFNGSYCALIYSYDGFGSSLTQIMDLTNVDVLSFYGRNEGGASDAFEIYFDGVLVYTNALNIINTWKKFEIDTSSYNGSTEIKFLMHSDHDLCIDDVVASVGVDPEPNDPIQETEKGTLCGDIFSTTGEKLGDVIVTDDTGKSDKSSYRFGYNIITSAGWHEVTASLDGYNSATESVYVHKDQFNELNFWLEPKVQALPDLSISSSDIFFEKVI
jgi:hypothetical protein